MQPSEITSGAAAPTGSPAAPNPAQLGQQDFLRMLIAQLENQDPLNPQDPTQFTSQLAQFSSLEQLISVRSSIEGLSSVSARSQVLASAGLIGRRVLAETPQLEVDDTGSFPALQFELSHTTEVGSVEILNGSGGVVASTSQDLGTLSAGLHRVDPAAFDKPLAPGVYSFRVNTQQGAPAEFTPLLEGRVTATATDQGEPVLMLGRIVALLSKVREVRQ